MKAFRERRVWRGFEDDDGQLRIYTAYVFARKGGWHTFRQGDFTWKENGLHWHDTPEEAIHRRAYSMAYMLYHFGDNPVNGTEEKATSIQASLIDLAIMIGASRREMEIVAKKYKPSPN
jgi:hypothetical protein